ncbi:MAG: hypothetical protein QGI24_09245 [Kiritimatiellia bacterium]|jgi:hypothetical protein|nr:hypothetical protein [Kiritimatiellia bacterium]MDP6848959.1 hypothetical protein [Kiritimatiellia bacterium]
MICYQNRLSGEQEDSALVSHISEQVAEICGHEHLIQSGNIYDIAHAVASFIDDSDHSHSVDSSYLVMLASQALSSIGEGEAAHRVYLFGTGMVRPAQWEVSGSEAMWVLDLREMTVLADADLEIVFFNSLAMILDSIAAVWDETGGNGVLGLRHVSSAVAALLGGFESKNQMQDLTSEIKDMCTCKLESVSQDRNWESVPLVMDLDVNS